MSETRIEAVVFSEFDQSSGSIIRSQYPLDWLRAESFTKISTFLYVQQKPGRVTSFISEGKKYVTCLRCSESRTNTATARGYMCNLIFILPESCVSCEYECLVRKLSLRITENGPEHIKFWPPDYIQKFLLTIYNRINGQENDNEPNKVMELLGIPSTAFCIDLHRPLPPMLELINDESVPVLVTDFSASDLTTQRIKKCIDGDTCVRFLEKKADVDIIILRSTIRNLLYYGAIRLITMYNEYNRYQYVSIEAIKGSCMLQRSLQLYLCQLDRQYSHSSYNYHHYNTRNRNKMRHNSSINTSGKKVPQKHFDETHVFSIDSIMKFYQWFDGYTSAAMVKMKIASIAPNSFDIKRLIKFGEFHGIIRRVHCYPIKDRKTPDILFVGDTEINLNLFFHLFNGRNSFDKIYLNILAEYKDIDASELYSSLMNLEHLFVIFK
ncbi:hypothetical protein SNEBB_008932 [Seison nebaliae]|nr:hypothetical protein SNEBB_008932 [Seison nebaliae]